MSIEALLDRLREALAHPEWVGAVLQRDDLLVLFDHLDQLGEVRDQRDAVAREFWRPDRPHSDKDYGLAAILRHWPDFYALLTKLPNPHTRGEDHDQ